MNEFDKDPFMDRAKEILDSRVKNTDAGTQARLKQARMAALASLDSPSKAKQAMPWLPLIPAGALAAGLLAVVVYMDRGQPPLPSIHHDPDQQAAAENIDLLDDLEFTAWLVMQEGT